MRLCIRRNETESKAYGKARLRQVPRRCLIGLFREDVL